jgi:hypothetical protein
MSVIQSMYDDVDAYILQDGSKVNGRVDPSRGVKQGCPLSPLLLLCLSVTWGSGCNSLMSLTCLWVFLCCLTPYGWDAGFWKGDSCIVR